MTRRFGDPPHRGRTYAARPGAYAVLLRGAHVLLTCQLSPRFEYQLPGGGIDPGEQPLSALHREVYEETGWRISRPRRLGAFRRFVYMPDYGFHAEKVCHVYLARPTLHLGPPTEPDHRAVWMRSDAAAALLGNRGDAHFLTNALQAES